MTDRNILPQQDQMSRHMMPNPVDHGRSPPEVTGGHQYSVGH